MAVVLSCLRCRSEIGLELATFSCWFGCRSSKQAAEASDRRAPDSGYNDAIQRRSGVTPGSQYPWSSLSVPLAGTPVLGGGAGIRNGHHQFDCNQRAAGQKLNSQLDMRGLENAMAWLEPIGPSLSNEQDEVETGQAGISVGQVGTNVGAFACHTQISAFRPSLPLGIGV